MRLSRYTVPGVILIGLRLDTASSRAFLAPYVALP